MAMIRKQLHNQLRQLQIPGWLAFIYGILAAFLIPWTVVLSYSLPYRHVSSHWDVAWVGFDVLLLISIAATAYFAVYRSGWVVLSAMAAATLLTADAWMDVWTSRPGRQTHFAIIIAVFVELPLAAMSFWLSQRVGRELIAHHGKL